MPHLVPEGSLDDQQRLHLQTIRENPNQSYWISGFPGSGKTVLLYYFLRDIHRAGKQVSFTTFTHTLLRLFNSITDELGVTGVFHDTIYQYLHRAPTTEVLLCDEVQDFSQRMIDQISNQNIRLLVSGDGNQSIYKEDPIFNSEVLSVDRSKQILNVVELKLVINHRLPNLIIRGINTIMGSNAIWAGADGTKQGTLTYFQAPSRTDEVRFIFDDACQKTQKAGKTVAVLFPTKQNLIEFTQLVLDIKGIARYDSPHRFNSFNNYLNNNEIPIEIVVNNYGDLRNAESQKKIVAMTMHGAKGLDFDTVIIPFFSFNYEIYPVHPDLESTLLMVAMSRAKNDLIFSFTGSAHPKLQRLIDSGICQRMVDPATVSSNDNDIILDF
jgi:superfamily I DNA/RNA helicase